MSKYILIVQLILLIIIGCESRPDKEDIILSAMNETKDINAEIVKYTTEENTSYLTDGEYYLRFISLFDSTIILVDEDLLKGQGGYESGVLSISWIDSNKLFIERVLYDRKQNLIFDLKTLSLKGIRDSIK